MNLAAILPQAGAISERCQIVQSTFLALCCFLVTRRLSPQSAALRCQKNQVLAKKPYFSCPCM